MWAKRLFLWLFRGAGRSSFFPQVDNLFTAHSLLVLPTVNMFDSVDCIYMIMKYRKIERKFRVESIALSPVQSEAFLGTITKSWAKASKAVKLYNLPAEANRQAKLHQD